MNLILSLSKIMNIRLTPMTVDKIVDDVHAEILKWPLEDRNRFFKTEYDENSLISYHHSLGTYIRNKYKLWAIPWEPEVRDGVDYSPYHPDEVSFTIIKEVWKRGVPTSDN